uniref:Large ribosomal subunit protein uL18m n=1 Tax=Ornithorhynchus anatinus TaxID=9258 RepID=A0A6I8N097_ORNAN
GGEGRWPITTRLRRLSACGAPCRAPGERRGRRVGPRSVPVLQPRGPRPREARRLARGHPAAEGRGRDSNPCPPDSPARAPSAQPRARPVPGTVLSAGEDTRPSGRPAVGPRPRWTDRGGGRPAARGGGAGIRTRDSGGHPPPPQARLLSAEPRRSGGGERRKGGRAGRERPGGGGGAGRERGDAEGSRLSPGLRLASASAAEPEAETRENERIAPEFVNRNPRNLERLAVARKERGWATVWPGREFWHRLKVERSQRHVTASVERRDGRTVVSASTREWAVKRHLYRTGNAAACENVGRVLAGRCLEAGVGFVGFQATPWEYSSPSIQRLLKALTDGGVELKEPRRIYE